MYVCVRESVGLCFRVYVCVRERACVRISVPLYVYECVCACFMQVRVCVYVCLHACVYLEMRPYLCLQGGEDP